MGKKIGTFGLVNYRRHPSDPNYVVFNFNTEQEAEIFERELNKTKTWFEKDTDQSNGETLYLYAVSESSMNEATRANGVVRTVTKEPMLKNKPARLFIITFVLFLTVLGIIGYVKNPNNASNSTSEINSDSTNLAE